MDKNDFAARHAALCGECLEACKGLMESLGIEEVSTRGADGLLATDALWRSTQDGPREILALRLDKESGELLYALDKETPYGQEGGWEWSRGWGDHPEDVIEVHRWLSEALAAPEGYEPCVMSVCVFLPDGAARAKAEEMAERLGAETQDAVGEAEEGGPSVLEMWWDGMDAEGIGRLIAELKAKGAPERPRRFAGQGGPRA